MDKRVVMRFDDSEDVLRFVSGEVVPQERLADVLEAGAATPDHLLNTRRTPLWIEPADPSDPQGLVQAAREAYDRWVAAYDAY